MRRLVAAAALLLLAAADDAFVIRVDNEAQLPEAELDSILKDFRAWAARVYAYNHVEHPAPVTLKLTRRASFGFYEGDTVILPPSDDRWMMLDDWVHELSHHATGHDSSFFFKEGIAVHTLEHLFAEQHRVSQTWPQFGERTDAWVDLYVARRRMPSLHDALGWEGWSGNSADGDFHSWQIYNIAGSFVGWYIARYGYDAFHAAFVKQWPAQDSASLERDWLASIRAEKLPPFDPASALPADNPRYRGYLEHLKRP